MKAKTFENFVNEAVNEAIGYKAAQKFTKKLNDDKLLQQLIAVTDKIHDKMGTGDDVNDWLLQIITYGNKHPQLWSESLDEAVNEEDNHNNEILDTIDKIHQLIGTLKKDGSPEEKRMSSKLWTLAGPLVKTLHSMVQ